MDVGNVTTLHASGTYYVTGFPIYDIGGNIGMRMGAHTAAAENHPTFTFEVLSNNVQRICKNHR